MSMVDLEVVDVLHVGTMASEVIVEDFVGCDPEMEFVAPHTLGALIWTRGGGRSARHGARGRGLGGGNRGPCVGRLGRLGVGCGEGTGLQGGGGGLNGGRDSEGHWRRGGRRSLAPGLTGGR